VPEQYIYGQIHVNGLDRAGTDPFTSAREQVIANDPIYRAVLAELKLILKNIYDHWDIMRIQLKEEGDPTTKNASKDTRAADQLAKATMKHIRDKFPAKEQEYWDTTLKELVDRASLNSRFYTRAFFAENLLRHILIDAGYQHRSDYPDHIQQLLYEDPNPETPNINMITDQPTNIQQRKGSIWKNIVERTRAKEAKQGYNGRTSIRHTISDLDYLLLSDLLRFADKTNSNGLSFRAVAPDSIQNIEKILLLRNIIMHCCTLTRYGREEFMHLYEHLIEEMIEFTTSE